MSVKTTKSPIPTLARPIAEPILQLTRDFCHQNLDGEYAELCEKMIGRLARKRPSPLFRGDPNVWAASIIYTIGIINFLFDPFQKPHIRSDQINTTLGVAKSSMVNKSLVLRNLLKLKPTGYRILSARAVREKPSSLDDRSERSDCRCPRYAGGDSSGGKTSRTHSRSFGR